MFCVCEFYHSAVDYSSLHSYYLTENVGGIGPNYVLNNNSDNIEGTDVINLLIEYNKVYLTVLVFVYYEHVGLLSTYTSLVT